ncbi:asparagine synthase-related protein [Schnuerera sp.]|uniref:asparagine synthase-related protein n=1 Tax=Schnuerera sp. TaxID=2794844 RepID=UPI002D80B691|nr:asparagine synthase-related protein [Schnuerera sp.]
MSGIAGVCHRNNSKELVKKILEKIKHRGPDDTSIISIGETALGQTCFTGEKIGNKDNMVAVVDGDIFNEDLDNDTIGNKIINGYLNYGKEFIQKLEGSFAFILTDGNKVMAARDPVGLKPLYYTEEEGNIIYLASEIKALKDMTEDIRIFPPGYYYHSDKGFIKYYEEPTLGTNDDMPVDRAIPKVKELLVNAVEKAYEDNKKVGLYLSGGIDSSVIVSAASEITDNIDTFAVGMSTSEDIPNARIVAKHLGTNHNEYIYEPEEMLKILPEVIYYLESFDMFLVRSSIANYLVSKMAKENGVDLVFSGEGGDELFGGYHYLKNFNDEEIESELLKLTFNAHNNGFQRIDRMTVAHSLDVNIPIMDKKVAEFAYSLPVDWKVYEKDGKKIEKWILRKAFEEDLPEKIVWRRKSKFFKGTGSSDILKEFAEQMISDEEFEHQKYLEDGFILRSKEELYYYKIFKEYFPHKSILDTIGRTRTTKKPSLVNN